MYNLSLTSVKPMYLPLVVLVVLSIGLCVSLSATAQVEVVEGQPAVVTEGEYGSPQEYNSERSNVYSSNPPPAAASAGSSAELFVQLQALQAEVRELRGLVEQQSYTIEQLSQRRMDDYLDLDRRIGQLNGLGSSVAASATSSNTGATAINGSGSRVVNASASTAGAATSSSIKTNTTKTAITNTTTISSASPAVTAAPVPASPSAAAKADEAKQAYRAAYQKVKDRQFDQARVALVGFVNAYPGSHYVPNAHFWLGELYYLESDLDNSRQSFSALVKGYPEHRKVADAKFKLGKVYHQLGDQAAARAMLESVLNDHPGSTAANPAREYLKNSLR